MKLQNLFLYNSKNLFEKLDQINGFYTVLAFSRLGLFRFRQGGILGLVRLTRVSDFPSYLRQHPLALLRSDGTLVGLNLALAEKCGAPDPKSLLLKPARKLMSGDPLQRLMSEPLETPVQWKTESASGNRLLETGAREQERLFKIGEADLTEKELKIIVTFRLLKGEPPVFLFTGGEYDNDILPDYDGYLAGYSAPRQAFQIKKCGRVLHEVPYQTAFPPGDYCLEALRQGTLFSLWLNGRRVMAFRDMNPIESPRTRLFLHFRKVSALSLSGLEIQTAPKTAPEPGMNEVSFLNGTENSHLFYSYLDLHAGVEKEHLYGLIFYDVSPFKKDLSRIENERDRYRALAAGRAGEPAGLVSEDPAMRALLGSAAVAASSNAAVLIEGETGTGKEVLARFIHGNSPFREGPFVKVDCSTLPDSLVESELFGFEKGAFTGAIETRKGKLEAAHNGTLFIDEIGNMSLQVQAKLLGFLQDLTVTRLGSAAPLKVETRVVAASNKPLQDLIRQGLFRPDLFYRLNSVRFALPPLRERKEDIVPLALHFLKAFNKKFRRSARGFSPAAFRRLMDYGWPGNVRELENAVQKAVLFCQDRQIGEGLLDLAGESAIPSTAVPVGDSRALKREHLLYLLEKHNWIIKRAAGEAKVSLPTFFRKMKRFSLRRNRRPE